MTPNISFDQPGTYQIRVQGELDPRWLDYFAEMTIEKEACPDGTQITLLTGICVDQAAVQGLLQKLYNLGFLLLSVEKID